MVPATLAHYQILEKLGQGGMGEVYLAFDTVLERHVAVKVLPEGVAADPKKLQRFEREAKLVAALNHPNIVTLHSVESAGGVHFLTMELVEGDPLDRLIPTGGMEVRRLFEVGIALADALAAAHARNITHRDVKPANVMVTRDGRVKVLDFGLAKALHGDPETGPAAHAPTQQLTEEGALMGTVPYMSPERLEGRALDPRSDIFSLGVVLFEMAAGRRPFEGNTTMGLISSILRDPPPPLEDLKADLPRHLGRIVRHCLEKDPDRRFQSVLDVRNQLEDLRRETSSGETAAADTVAKTVERTVVASPNEPPQDMVVRPATVESAVSSRIRTRIVEEGRRSGSRIALGIGLGVLIAFAAWWFLGRPGPEGGSPESQRSIAVLPFQNLSGEDSIDHLKLAVPGEIVTALSRSPVLAVRPFATSAAYDAAAVDLQAAGRKLGVSYLVTGQYYAEGEELRLTFEAVDAGTNRLLWRDSVAAPREDLVALRQVVTLRVRRGLMAELGAAGGDEEAGAVPSNQEAYRLFLRALTASTNSEPNRQAIEMLEESIALDPGFAPAWAELSSRYHLEGTFSSGGLIWFERARHAVREALRLDPDLVQAVRRLILMEAEFGDLMSAFDHAEALLRRRPQDGEAHFALSYVLRYAGLLEESTRECDAARKLDPTNRRFRSCYRVFELLGDHQRAQVFIDLDSGTDWFQIVEAYQSLRQGRKEEAAQSLRAMASLTPPMQYLLRCAEGAPQSELDALADRNVDQIARFVRDGEMYYRAGADMVFCGSTRQGWQLLRSAVARGFCTYPHLLRDPFFDGARELPELDEIRDAGLACQERFLAHRADAGLAQGSRPEP